MNSLRKEYNNRWNSTIVNPAFTIEEYSGGSSMPRATIDAHIKQLQRDITNGNQFAITCLNFLAKHASGANTRKDWAYIGHQLIMLGWLTVDNNNDFQVKG